MSTPFNLFTMNTASLDERRYNKRHQFCEGVRINATKSEQDASKIFMGGLSPELSKQALLEYLSQFGEIMDFIIKIDPNTGLSRGFGFVLFEDSSTVEKVLGVKDHKVDGKKVEFKRAKAIESQFPIKKIFVGGLNPRMSEEKIRSYFGTFGQIEAIELPVCSDTKKRRAFGFIKYMEEKPLRKVLETRFHFIGSSRCEVKMALPKGYPGRQQSKNKASTVVREKKAVPTDRFENHWGGRDNQSFHFMANSDAQEANLGAPKAGTSTLRANSNITLASSTGFRNTAHEFQVNLNVLVRNSMALGARQNALGPNSDSFGVNNYTLGSNPNPSWENQYALGASPNSFRTSQYILEPYPDVLGESQCALRATSNVFWTNQCPLETHPIGLGVSQYTSLASPNVISTNQYPLEAHSNRIGVSQWALGTTPNIFCTNQCPLETHQNGFEVSQHTSGATSNVFWTNQYPLETNPNAFGLSQCALGASPNAFCTNHCPLEIHPNGFGVSRYTSGETLNVFSTNQHPLETIPNTFRVNQYSSGKSPNAFGASQYTLSSNSDTFSLNYYSFVTNPCDFHTSHYVLATTPSVFRTSPNALGANTNAFGASHYDLRALHNASDANQNAFGANVNFCEANESGRSTEGLNLSQVNNNCLNIYNNQSAFHGSNGDYFFLYSYWAYDLGSLLNSNEQINESSRLGNRYQGIYSTFEA